MTTLNSTLEIIQQYIYHNILFYQLISIKKCHCILQEYTAESWANHRSSHASWSTLCFVL